MKTSQMRTNGGYLFRGCYSQGVSHCPCVGQRLQGSGGVGKPESEKASGVLWLEAVAMGKLEVG